MDTDSPSSSPCGDSPLPPREPLPTPSTFIIPRASKNKELLTDVEVESRDGQKIIADMKSCLWDAESSMDVKSIKRVGSDGLAKQFADKRQNMLSEGRSKRDTADGTYAFKYVTTIEKVKKICNEGVKTQTQETNIQCLGNPKYGVYLCRCPDVLTKVPVDTTTGYVIIFQIMGKWTGVAEQWGPNIDIEPTPNYDGHISKSYQRGKKATHQQTFISSQYYLYEIDLDAASPDDFYVSRPRQCLPKYVMKVRVKRPTQAEGYRVPIGVNTQASAPAVPSSPADAPVTVDETVEETPVQNQVMQPTDTPLDNLLELWRGNLHRREVFLAECAIKCYGTVPYKLPLASVPVLSIDNWICISKLANGILPPRIYQRMPLHTRNPQTSASGFTFIHSEMHPVAATSRYVFERLYNLLLENQKAVVCSFNFGCKLYIIPTSDFTHQLGLTNRASLQVLHCLFMRYQDVLSGPILNGPAYDTFIKKQREFLNVRIGELETLKRSKSAFDANRKKVLQRFKRHERQDLFKLIKEINAAESKSNRRQQQHGSSSTSSTTASNRHLTTIVSSVPTSTPTSSTSSTTGLSSTSSVVSSTEPRSTEAPIVRNTLVRTTAPPVISRTTAPPVISRTTASISTRTTAVTTACATVSTTATDALSSVRSVASVTHSLSVSSSNAAPSGSSKQILPVEPKTEPLELKEEVVIPECEETINYVISAAATVLPSSVTRCSFATTLTTTSSRTVCSVTSMDNYIDLSTPPDSQAEDTEDDMADDVTDYAVNNVTCNAADDIVDDVVEDVVEDVTDEVADNDAHSTASSVDIGDADDFMTAERLAEMRANAPAEYSEYMENLRAIAPEAWKELSSEMDYIESQREAAAATVAAATTVAASDELVVEGVADVDNQSRFQKAKDIASNYSEDLSNDAAGELSVDDDDDSERSASPEIPMQNVAPRELDEIEETTEAQTRRSGDTDVVENVSAEASQASDSDQIHSVFMKGTAALLGKLAGKDIPVVEDIRRKNNWNDDEDASHETTLASCDTATLISAVAPARLPLLGQHRRRKSRSKSPRRKSRSKSPKRKSKSKSPKRKSGSKSPKRHSSFSKSPVRGPLVGSIPQLSRSTSPDMKSKSPKRRSKSQGRKSPRRHSKSKSPRRRSRSKSPARRRSRSRSPTNKRSRRRSRSRSSEVRSRSRSQTSAHPKQKRRQKAKGVRSRSRSQSSSPSPSPVKSKKKKDTNARDPPLDRNGNVGPVPSRWDAQPTKSSTEVIHPPPSTERTLLLPQPTTSAIIAAAIETRSPESPVLPVVSTPSPVVNGNSTISDSLMEQRALEEQLALLESLAGASAAVDSKCRISEQWIECMWL